MAINSARPETFAGYHFLILDSIELNSFSAPGGLIFITRGLLRLSTSEGMIACILAYSISHVVMRSGLETIKRSRLVDAYLKLATAALQDPENEELKKMDPKIRETVKTISKRLTLSGLNKQQVLDADEMALDIVSKTGYDPRELGHVLNSLLIAKALGQSSKASTFPTLEDRIAAVERELETTSIPKPTQEDLDARQNRFAEALDRI